MDTSKKEHTDSHPSGLFSRIRSGVRALLDRAAYWSPSGYDARKFWQQRLGTFGLDDLRGAGIMHYSHEKNKATYERAAKTFLNFCAAEGVRFPDVRVLEVGCGTGFYTDICAVQRVHTYVGVDVADVLFDQLCKRFPDYAFQQLDVASQELSGAYDLIIMIDVTQHIVSPEAFMFAMRNLRDHLAKGGIIIMTSWLSERPRKVFYEVSRTLSTYQKEFEGFVFGAPRPFRDKYIFSMRAPR